MSKLMQRVPLVLSIVTAVGLIWLGMLAPVPAVTSPSSVTEAAPAAQLATAPSPPTLVPAILNGEPIQVLYMTRAGDTVLVRCYPGYEPTLTVRTMGGGGGQKEGVLTCKTSES